MPVLHSQVLLEVSLMTLLHPHAFLEVNLMPLLHSQVFFGGQSYVRSKSQVFGCYSYSRSSFTGVFIWWSARSTFTNVFVASIMPVLHSQVHLHPGPQVPCEEEICGHHEDRIWYEDVRHT